MGFEIYIFGLDSFDQRRHHFLRWPFEPLFSRVLRLPLLCDLLHGQSLCRPFLPPVSIPCSRGRFLTSALSHFARFESSPALPSLGLYFPPLPCNNSGRANAHQGSKLLLGDSQLFAKLADSRGREFRRPFFGLTGAFLPSSLHHPFRANSGLTTGSYVSSSSFRGPCSRLKNRPFGSAFRTRILNPLPTGNQSFIELKVRPKYLPAPSTLDLFHIRSLFI